MSCRNLTIIIGCIVLFSCNSCPEPVWPNGPYEGWTWVATIGGLDSITDIHIFSLLKSHGIDCSIEGSIFYGVSVRSKDVSRARDILKADLKERQYKITIYDGEGKQITYSIPETLWKTVAARKKYQDLLEEHAESTDIGSVLRCPKFVADAHTFPYVMILKSLKREYFGEKGKLQTGHELEIELVVSLDERIGGKYLHCQVWDDGKKIEFMGSGEWWQGTPEVVAANRKKYDKRRKSASDRETKTGGQ